MFALSVTLLWHGLALIGQHNFVAHTPHLQLAKAVDHMLYVVLCHNSALLSSEHVNMLGCLAVLYCWCSA